MDGGVSPLEDGPEPPEEVGCLQEPQNKSQSWFLILGPCLPGSHDGQKKTNQRELADLKVEARHLRVRDPGLQSGTVFVALQIRRQPITLQLHTWILAVVDGLHTSTHRRGTTLV